jgi:hypothetical protein
MAEFLIATTAVYSEFRGRAEAAMLSPIERAEALALPGEEEAPLPTGHHQPPRRGRLAKTVVNQCGKHPSVKNATPIPGAADQMHNSLETLCLSLL